MCILDRHSSFRKVILDSRRGCLHSGSLEKKSMLVMSSISSTVLTKKNISLLEDLLGIRKPIICSGMDVGI